MDASELEAKIASLQSKASDVELIWASDAWKSTSGTISSLSVLDSSFNPPTLAHLSLALIPPLHPLHTGRISAEGVTSGYLLLLSVRNADKQLKPGDATFVQRLQMMILLAEEMQSRASTDPSRAFADGLPVAVAAIDEPTFVGKSIKILKCLAQDPSRRADSAPPTLTFILGYDTITRFFDPKYYGTQKNMRSTLRTFFEDEHSSIVCARRNSSPSTTASSSSPGESPQSDEEAALLASDDVHPYVESERVRMVDIGADEAAMSSTLVREAAAAEGNAGAASPSGKSLDAMVIPAIAQYIREQSLYGFSRRDLLLAADPE